MLGPIGDDAEAGAVDGKRLSRKCVSNGTDRPGEIVRFDLAKLDLLGCGRARSSEEYDQEGISCRGRGLALPSQISRRRTYETA